MENLISDFKNDFRQQYPYIYFDDFITDNQIEVFIEEYMGEPYHHMLNYFADYCMSQGCEVQA
jgi:hypothetical protein